MSTLQLVRQLKENNQDFEFYPTTQEMIDVIIRDIPQLSVHPTSFLDIGGGDGRIVRAVKKAFSYCGGFVIEKSSILLENLSLEFSILGTDFYETDLSDKPVDIIFSNPPYFEYEEWMIRILKTGNAQCGMYFIVPSRWANNNKIKFVLEQRDARVEVIAQMDFLDADRQARAKVDILRINTRYQKETPFDLLIREEFGEIKFEEEKNESVENEKIIFDLRSGEITLETIVSDYLAELDKVRYNYQAILSLDGKLLKELGINLNTLTESLKLRLSGLKEKYWGIFFTCYNPIYDYLTRESVRKFRDKLNKRLDFTLPNMIAITKMIMRHAEAWKDEQIIHLFKSFTTPENILNYKSNQRVFDKNLWRFNQSKPTHYLLDYRIITQVFEEFSYWNRHQIEAQVKDILVIAKNLGFSGFTLPDFNGYLGGFGQRIPVYFTSETGEKEILVELKFFKNGNVHLFFNQEFTMRFNVECGRLLGWLRNKEEAVKETGYSLEVVEKAFGVSQRCLLQARNLLPNLEKPAH